MRCCPALTRRSDQRGRCRAWCRSKGAPRSSHRRWHTCGMAGPPPTGVGPLPLPVEWCGRTPACGPPAGSRGRGPGWAVWPKCMSARQRSLWGTLGHVDGRALHSGRLAGRIGPRAADGPRLGCCGTAQGRDGLAACGPRVGRSLGGHTPGAPRAQPARQRTARGWWRRRGASKAKQSTAQHSTAKQSTAKQSTAQAAAAPARSHAHSSRSGQE